jgi:hypothetical protein
MSIWSTLSCCEQANALIDCGFGAHGRLTTSRLPVPDLASESDSVI